MTILNPNPDPKPSRLVSLAIMPVLGAMPFLFVAGLDSPDLLPRLLLLQLGTLFLAFVWFREEDPIFWSPFHTPALIYILILAASSLWATVPYQSVHLLSKHITFYCFFFCLSSILKKELIPNILLATALAGAIASLYGIFEYHNVIPQWIPSTGRPSSTFMFRNLAAHYLVLNIPLSLSLALIAKTRRIRWIAAVCVCCMFIFLLYTRTRGAWVGLFCASLLCFGLWIISCRSTFYLALGVLLNRKAQMFAVGLVLAIALIGSLPAGFTERHTQRFDEKKADISSALTSIFRPGGDRGRTRMWQHTISMILDHPLGVGMGNWEFFYPLYDKGEQISPDTTPRRPHNDLLWIASEIGVPGLVAYLALLIAVLITCLRIWRKESKPEAHVLALVSGIAVMAMTGDGIFNFPYERIPPSVLFWLSLSLLAVTYRDLFPGPVRRFPRALIALMSIILLGAICITVKNIAFDFYYIRAIRASLAEQSDSAADAAGKALSYGPFNHQAFVIYGRALKDQKKYAQAETALHAARRYHPNFANIYNNTGHLYDDWGRWDDAIVEYNKSITLMPTHYKAIYNLGIIYEKQGLLDSANVAFHRALTMNGGFGKAYHNLAGVFKKQNQPDSARAYYLKAISAVNPTQESYFNLGNLFAEERRFKPAIQAYEAFLANWKGDSTWVLEARKGLGEAYSGLGVQKEQGGDLEQAFGLYQTALSFWPENAMNWYNLGNAYRLRADPEQAISSYQKAIETDSLFTNAYNNMGLTYTELKQFDRAIETFQKSLEVDPGNPIAYINMANAYLNKGDIYRAITAYEMFLTLSEGEDATTRQVIEVLKELKSSLP
jgi:tetratricopeptide (TPR) repeat protein/O-antigen ligase